MSEPAPKKPGETGGQEEQEGNEEGEEENEPEVVKKPVVPVVARPGPKNFNNIGEE